MTSALSAVIVAGVAALVIFHVRSVENAWFWSVTVLADDGLNNLLIWGYEHFKLSIHLVTVSIILIWVAGMKSLHPLASLGLSLKRCSCCADHGRFRLRIRGTLQAASRRGGCCNTELQLSVFPFIFLIFKGIDEGYQLPSHVLRCDINSRCVPGHKPINSLAGLKHFSELEHGESQNVFTTSDYYGVVRSQRNKTGIHNWHHEILINKVADADLPAFIHDRNFAYGLPAFSSINADLEKDFGYEPVYQNNHLMILKKDGGA